MAPTHSPLAAQSASAECPHLLLPAIWLHRRSRFFAPAGRADDAALPDDVALGNETIIISYLKPNITLQMVDDFRWARPAGGAQGANHREQAAVAASHDMSSHLPRRPCAPSAI